MGCVLPGLCHLTHCHMKPSKQTAWFHGGQFKEEMSNASSSFQSEVYGYLLKAMQKFFRKCQEHKPHFLVLVLDAQHF